MKLKAIGLLCLACLVWQLNASAQDDFWNEKGLILSKYQDRSDSVFQVTTEDKGDELIVRISGSDSLEITHFFRLRNTVHEESLCDSLVIRLLCAECVEKHTQKLIRSGERKWLLLPDSVYISRRNVSSISRAGKSPKRFGVPMMKIDRGVGCTTVTIYRRELTAKEWKALKRTGVAV